MSTSSEISCAQPALRGGIGGAAGLVDLPEATVRGGARRKSGGRSVGGEVALGVGVVVRVDDRDGSSRPVRRGGGRRCRTRPADRAARRRHSGGPRARHPGRSARARAAAAAASVRTRALQCATPGGVASEQTLTSTSPSAPWCSWNPFPVVRRSGRAGIGAVRPVVRRRSRRRRADHEAHGDQADRGDENRGGGRRTEAPGFRPELRSSCFISAVPPRESVRNPQESQERDRPKVPANLRPRRSPS